MKNNKWKILEVLCKFLLIAFMVSAPVVQAVDLNQGPSAEDKANYDQMLIPVMKIYNFIKYTVSVVAAIALLYCGISYMFSGNDIKKRDSSKTMAAYVLIGLVIIWGAPVAVNMLTS